MPHKDLEARRAYGRALVSRWRAKEREAAFEERLKKLESAKSPDAVDLAWFAGMFEGEGTVSIVSSGKYSRCVVALTNTDKSIVDLFHDFWPGTITRNKVQKGTHRPSYTWVVYAEPMMEFLYQIRPFLKTESRKKRVDLVIECQKLRWRGQRVAEHQKRISEIFAEIKTLNRRGAVPGKAVAELSSDDLLQAAA